MSVKVPKVLILLLGILFVIIQTGGPGNLWAQDYEWNKAVPKFEPAPEKNNGKLVLFDVSHMSTTGQSDWVINGGFSDFATALVNEGFTVEEYRGVDKNQDGLYTFADDRLAENIDKNEWIITYEAIKHAHVLVLAESNRPFRKDEYAALKQFLEAGKGIYFVSDHYNADRNKNTWDSTETFNGYNRSTQDRYNIGGAYGDLRNPGQAHKGWLAETFGIRFRFNGVDWKPGASDIRPPAQCEGLTEGVGPVLIAAGCTLAIVDGSRAKGLVYLSDNDNEKPWKYAVDKGLYFGDAEEGPVVAIAKAGRGKGAFIGDSSPIEDITPRYRKEEGGKKNLHDGWVSPGNAARLTINIIHWLSITEEYTHFDSPEHPRGIETPQPMADAEKSQPKPEPWAPPTIDPWNPETFKPGAYGAPKAYASGSPGHGQVTPASQKIHIKLSPDFVYLNQPFVVLISLDEAGLSSAKPQLGIYLEGGRQIGQVKGSDGQWSSVGYADLPPSQFIIANSRATMVGDKLTIKARLSKSKFDSVKVTGIEEEFDFIKKDLPGEEGNIIAAVKDNKILGTGLVDQEGKVTVAVMKGNDIKLEIYEPNGVKKADLPGIYTVPMENPVVIALNYIFALLASIYE